MDLRTQHGKSKGSHINDLTKLTVLATSTLFGNAQTTSAHDTENVGVTERINQTEQNPYMSEIENLRASYELMRTQRLANFQAQALELKEVHRQTRADLAYFAEFSLDARMLGYLAESTFDASAELENKYTAYMSLITQVRSDLEQMMTESTSNGISEQMSANLAACNEMAAAIRAEVFNHKLNENIVLTSRKTEERYKKRAADATDEELDLIVAECQLEILIEAASLTYEQFGIARAAYISSVIFSTNIPEDRQDSLLASFISLDHDGLRFDRDIAELSKELAKQIGSGKSPTLSTEDIIDLTLVQSRNTLSIFTAQARDPISFPNDGEIAPRYPHGPNPSSLDDIDYDKALRDSFKSGTKRYVIRKAVTMTVQKSLGAAGYFVFASTLNEGSDVTPYEVGLNGQGYEHLPALDKMTSVGIAGFLKGAVERQQTNSTGGSSGTTRESPGRGPVDDPDFGNDFGPDYNERKDTGGDWPGRTEIG